MNELDLIKQANHILNTPYRDPDDDGSMMARWALKLVEERNKVMEIGIMYGQTDGAHHKQWVIDQILRAIAGAAYPAMIETMKEIYGDYDEGIAP